MASINDTSAQLFAVVLAATWCGFGLYGIVRKLEHSPQARGMLRRFRQARLSTKAALVAGLVAVVAVGGTKPGGTNDPPRGMRSPTASHDIRTLPEAASPAFALVEARTNGAVLAEASTNAVVSESCLRCGTSEGGEWIETTAPFFYWGTNDIRRLYASPGCLSFGTMRHPFHGDALPNGTDAESLVALRMPIGIVPAANWGSLSGGASPQGEPMRSRFWHDVLPGGGRVFTWENALLDRLASRPATIQVELHRNGDFIYRYDFSESGPPGGRPLPADYPAATPGVASVAGHNPVLIGAQKASAAVEAFRAVGSETNSAVVYRLDGDAATNGVSVADLLAAAPLLEFRWKNVSGLGDLSGDTDGDGLTDWQEVFLHGTDPRYADTDGDGIVDNVELMMDMNPRNPDTDGDGMADGWDADPTTAATSPAFGQSAAWLAAAGVDGATNALEWAQGVAATNEETHVLGISVANATPAFPASVSLSGFPTVILDDDTTLWFPVAVADAYVFDFICEAELEIGLVEPPPHPLPRSGNVDVHTVEGSDGWNLVSTARGKRGWYMRKPWQQLSNCTGEINSTWMSFKVETRPRKGGTYTWSSMPEEFLRRVDDNRALCLWPDDSQVGTAMIRVVWEKDSFAVTNFLVIGRPPRQEGETPLLSLDIDGGTEGIVFVQTNGLGQVILQGQEPAYLTCRVASTSAVASVTLDCPQSGKVRVRTMANGNETEISLPYNWNPQTTGTETAFKVLGAETSDAVRDIRFTATIPDTPVSASADMTVARVEHETLSTYPQGCSSRTSLGVGEEVQLSVIPNGTYRGGHWSAGSGNLETGQNSPVAYAEAPYRAGILNVTFAYLGKQADIAFDVFEPVKFVADASAVMPTSYLGPNHAGGLSAYIDPIFLFPTNVSFYRVATMEGFCNASDIEGYFTYCETNSLVHGIAQGAGTWTPTEADNYAGGDTAAMTNDIPVLPFVDGTSGWIPGQFRFQIPLYFRIWEKTSHRQAFSCPTQPETFFAYGTQTYRLDAMGTLSIEKFSLRTTCDTNRFITVTTIP